MKQSNHMVLEKKLECSFTGTINIQMDSNLNKVLQNNPGHIQYFLKTAAYSYKKNKFVKEV